MNATENPRFLPPGPWSGSTVCQGLAPRAVDSTSWQTGLALVLGHTMVELGEPSTDAAVLHCPDLNPFSLTRQGVSKNWTTQLKPEQTVLGCTAEALFYTGWEGGNKKIPQAEQKTMLKLPNLEYRSFRLFMTM